MIIPSSVHVTIRSYWPFLGACIVFPSAMTAFVFLSTKRACAVGGEVSHRRCTPNVSRTDRVAAGRIY